MDADSKDIGIITDRVSETTCHKCGCKIDVTDLEPFLSVECPDCGSVEHVPAKLGQFLLLNLIGKGGMGGVYFAEDTSLGRQVAIKVMLQSLGDNTEFVETFKREAQAVAKLNHPNIVQIYAFGKEKGQPYIVMELVGGMRLDKMMEGGKQVDQALLMKIAVDVAEALKAADEIGLIHGDIKPENILLDEKGQAKLVDFGLATFAHQSSAEGVWGTPYYISPEKIRRQPADSRSDIYSLGATLYHALAGRPPFEGKTPIDVVKARLEKDPAQLHVLRPKIDRFVEGIVTRMLQRQPGRRFPNYGSLLGDLRKAVQTLGPVKTGTFAAPKAKSSLVVPKKRTSPISLDMGKNDESPKPKPSIKIHAPASVKGLPSVKGQSSIKGPEEEAGISGDSYSKRLLESVSKPKKDKIKIPKSMYVLAALGLIAWGITAAVLKHKQKKQDERSAKIETIELARERSTTEQTYSTIQLTVSNVCKIAQSSEPHINKVIDAVLVITGEQLQKPALNPKTGEDAPAVTAAQVEAAASSNATGAASAKTPATENKSGGKGKSGSAAAEKKEKAGAQPDKASPQQPPATDNKAVAEKPPAPPKPGVVLEKIENEHEVRGLARRIFENSIKMAANAAKAGSIEENTSITRNNALKALKSSAVGVENNKLSEELESLRMMESESKELLADSEKAVQKADSLKTQFEEAAQAKKKAEEDELKRKAEEEAANRKAEALKALVEEEKKTVESARKNVLPTLRLYDFNGALDSVNSQAGTLQTDEGKAAIKVLIDRYTYLKKLKLYLIEQLNAAPYKWGWLSPSQDIIGADVLGVKLRAKTVSWSEIGGGQMLRIIDFCLSSSGVHYKVKAENTLAAAILCHELGGVDAAKRYTEKAVELSVSMKADAARLLPPLE